VSTRASLADASLTIMAALTSAKASHSWSDDLQQRLARGPK
jgi:hypothetical protein